jgi:hypothetical protein
MSVAAPAATSPADPSRLWGRGSAGASPKRGRDEWQVEARAHDDGQLGIASYPTHGGTVEALCAVADASMCEESAGAGRALAQVTAI